MKNKKETKNLVTINKFWLDLAKYIVEHDTIEGFLSENFIYATKNFTEMIGLLTFLGF